MAGKDQRDSQALTHQGPNKTGIGVMGMNPVHPLTRTTQMGNELISQFLEVGPKQFLAQVTLGSEGKAQNAGPGSNRLLRTAVIH